MRWWERRSERTIYIGPKGRYMLGQQNRTLTDPGRICVVVVAAGVAMALADWLI